MLHKVIITDLDGTLLDASSYAFDKALPALQLLQQQQVPLVLCSSKTRAEIEIWRERLQNSHPFISENGGGIFIPKNYFGFQYEAEPFGDYLLLRLGKRYTEIREQFEQIRLQHKAAAIGFGDMTVQEVSALTGLADEEARLAKQRDFDEPFIFDGEVNQHFLDAINAAGLSWTRGRLFHIMGRHDKGLAVKLLLDLYRQQAGEIISMGLGDGLNDLQMLQVVDHPVLVAQLNGNYEAGMEIAGLHKTLRPGPAGWNEAVSGFVLNSI